MDEANRPDKGRFFIDEAIGISKDDFNQIVADMLRLERSDMEIVEIVKECVKGRNPYDIMVGFKLSTLVYQNEGRIWGDDP